MTDIGTDAIFFDIGFDLTNLPRRWVHVMPIGKEREFPQEPKAPKTICVFTDGYVETTLVYIITFDDGRTKIVPPHGDGWTYIGRDRRSSRWQRPTRLAMMANRPRWQEKGN
jgi:hypothetical protein